MDDAFQHRKVKAGYYVLLTKYKDLFSDDFLLPTGNLRESRRGAKRADVIVITKCPENLSEDEQNDIINKIKKYSKQKVYFSTINYDNELKGKRKRTIDELKEKEIVLVTGIANPEPLLSYLKTKKIKYKHLKYPDHHSFSKEDITKIEQVSLGGKIIITTEKDYVRLQNKVGNIFYIEIKNTFLNYKSSFETEIQSFLRK